MKGQTQALTAVLITTVTVGAITTAYVWGSPLLEKQQSQSELKQVEQNVINLRDGIESVARGGPDTASEINMNLNQGSVEVDAEKDRIIIATSAEQAPYPRGTWTLVEGESLQNLSIGSGSYAVTGNDLPGVVAVRAGGGEGETGVRYVVEFRNMYTDTPSGARLEKIDIESVGSETFTGETTMLVSNEGEEEDRIKVETGETLERTKTSISVDLR